MLISHRKKFIFVKTGKTGGTSVESYFERFCMPEGDWQFSHYRGETISEAGIIGYRGLDRAGARPNYYNHMPARLIRDALGTTLWENYFKFTIVRNPFDKLISAFFHFEKSRNPEKYDQSDNNDVENFRAWVSAGHFANDRSLYLIKGEISVDYFIRFESLAEGMRDVCERINVPWEPKQLRRLKSQFRDSNFPVRDFYDSRTEELVRNKYEFELDYFGYDMT